MLADVQGRGRTEVRTGKSTGMADAGVDGLPDLPDVSLLVRDFRDLGLDCDPDFMLLQAVARVPRALCAFCSPDGGAGGAAPTARTARTAAGGVDGRVRADG